MDQVGFKLVKKPDCECEESNNLMLASRAMDVRTLSNVFDSYATKKTFATGFFNLALIATNFKDLKELLMIQHANGWSNLQMTLLTLVCLSLVLQFIVGVVLVFLAKNGEFIDREKREILIRKNNLATLLVLAISIINVFINIFLHL